MPITTRDPAAMSGQERLQEIASILADRVGRSSENHEKQGTTTTLERGFSGLQAGRKHSCHHPETESGD